MQTTSRDASSEVVAVPSPATAPVDVPAIHTVELTKRFGSIQALAGLTMTVPSGEVFGFLGPNGAGKTTAVKLLVGLSQPSSGEGWVLGLPLADREVRRRIGYLPELFRYQDWLTGREVLDLHCRLARIPKHRRREEIEDALALVGLSGRGDDRVGTYSKGMQQRLGLGVALLGKPDVVFLDEPTSALDPVGRHDVRVLVRELKNRGVTVFLNSHLLSEVEQVCDRVAVVDKGRVIALGAVDEIRGAVSGVRISVRGLRSDDLLELSRFGQARLEGETLAISGTPTDAIPDIVARLVRLGAHVYSVEPGGGSLEESFLKLLQEHE